MFNQQSQPRLSTPFMPDLVGSFSIPTRQERAKIPVAICGWGSTGSLLRCPRKPAGHVEGCFVLHIGSQNPSAHGSDMQEPCWAPSQGRVTASKKRLCMHMGTHLHARTHPLSLYHTCTHTVRKKETHTKGVPGESFRGNSTASSDCWSLPNVTFLLQACLQLPTCTGCESWG